MKAKEILADMIKRVVNERNVWISVDIDVDGHIHISLYHTDSDAGGESD